MSSRPASLLARTASALAPLWLGVLLHGLNNLAILSGWSQPPAGYVPAFIIRTPDIAQYLAWMRAFQSQVFIPDYHAPWQTDPALFNALLWLIARASGAFGLPLVAGYHLFHLLLYVVTAYALVYALRVFLPTRGQRLLALVLAICSVPLTTFGVLPAVLVNWRPLPGIGDFVWNSSDGFFHGIGASILVTFGTGMTLLAFALLARYLQSGQGRFLALGSFVVLCCALVHPFEVFLIVPVGSLLLVLQAGSNWRRAARDLAVLGGAAGLGLLPYAISTLAHPWLRDATVLNRWTPPAPWAALVMLGLPTSLALVLLARRPGLPLKTDRLLQFWFVGALVGLYVPWMPHSQHLLDGFHYAVGMLLARQLSQRPLSWPRWQLAPRLGRAALVGCTALALVAMGAFYWQSWLDGSRAEPERLFSAVVPAEQVAAVTWLAQHAQPDDVVLAPLDSAPWFAIVPMHSVAGHWEWSLTYAEQARRSDEFFSGQLDEVSAGALLDGYSVRYVVLPTASPAARYLQDRSAEAAFGSLRLYDLGPHALRPYPGLGPVAAVSLR